jgi:predicted transcriptional regulator
MKTRQISSLEQEVMNLVWSQPQSSVKSIVERISQTKPVAYTTILTIMQRLHEKGMVSRQKGKKAYLYAPKISKETYSKNIAQGFLEKFLHSFGEIGIASFAQSIDSLSEDKRKHLLTLLENYDKTT